MYKTTKHIARHDSPARRPRPERRSGGCGERPRPRATSGLAVRSCNLLTCSNPHVDRCSNPLPWDPLTSPSNYGGGRPGSPKKRDAHRGSAGEACTRVEGEEEGRVPRTLCGRSSARPSPPPHAPTESPAGEALCSTPSRTRKCAAASSGT